MIDVGTIAAQLNERAATLAPELLPNGVRSCNYWMASGIADHGKSESLAVNLTGANIGHWRDYGNCHADEERGDMLDLVRLKLFGGDVRAAVQWAKRELGIEDPWVPGQRMDPAERERRAAEARERAVQREAKDQRDREAKARGARSLWLKARPMAGTPAEHYLRGRGLGPGPADSATGGEWPGSYRFHDEVWCKAERVKVPALLCASFTAEGKQIGTHRVWLGRDRDGKWDKLDTPKPKKILGNLTGGFIPVNKGASGKSMRQMPAGEPVYVTEGPEDAICVRMMKPSARIVCAISLWNMGQIILPPHAGELVIVADRDPHEDEQRKLERAIAQQQARGIKVSLVMPPEQVAGRRIKDINDWWNALQESGAGRKSA